MVEGRNRMESQMKARDMVGRWRGGSADNADVPASLAGKRRSCRGAWAGLAALTLLLASAESASAQTLVRPGGADVAQTPPIPESVAKERVAQVMEALEISDPASMKAFIAESRLASTSRAVDRTFAALMEIRAGTGDVELISSRVAGPGVEVVLKSRLTGWTQARAFMLDPNPPHGIQGIAISSPNPPADVAEGSLPDERLAQEAEALMSGIGRADVFSGAVLLARGSDVLFAEAYGDANKNYGVPNRLDTRFSLGSQNKMFTAVAIAQLVEAGKLSFEDPLSKFLPDHFAPGVAEKIRIEHLLTHTSGLGNYFNRKYMESSRARFRTIDDLMELNRGDSLAFEPGKGWRYSNTGFLVLGKIVELVSGQDYHDYVREHVYLPAGMESTGQFELDQVNRDIAVGYEKEYSEAGLRYRNNVFDLGVRGGPAGGGYSTVGDLHRFALALMGGKLVSPAMVEILITPKPELSSPTYGYGFRRAVVEGAGSDRMIVGHGGGFPGVSTYLDMVPSTGHVFVVLSNYGNGALWPLGLRKLFSR